MLVIYLDILAVITRDRQYPESVLSCTIVQTVTIAILSHRIAIAEEISAADVTFLPPFNSRKGELVVVKSGQFSWPGACVINTEAIGDDRMLIVFD